MRLRRTLETNTSRRQRRCEEAQGSPGPSAIIYGLSAALYGKVDIDNGRIVPANFDTNPVLTIGDAPEIVVEIANSRTYIGGVCLVLLKRLRMAFFFRDRQEIAVASIQPWIGKGATQPPHVRRSAGTANSAREPCPRLSARLASHVRAESWQALPLRLLVEAPCDTRFPRVSYVRSPTSCPKARCVQCSGDRQLSRVPSSLPRKVRLRLQDAAPLST